MDAAPRLGVRENLPQFLLLVLINAFVGGMIGLERTVLPLLAEQDFGLVSRSAILSFIVSFGLTKAAAKYVAGRLSDRIGRKGVLTAGWLFGLPVPLILMVAPSWGWIVFANVLLGINQGLAWSMAVVMKVDLAGPMQRGLALCLNEFAGYVAVALSALASGYVAATWGVRPYPFYLGVGFAIAGLLLTVLLVRETRAHAAHEASHHVAEAQPTGREVFLRTSFEDRNLSAATQAGMINNLNDGMAWGLFPLVFKAAGLSLTPISWLVALYPATWGVAQLFTGAWSDRVGRKWLIAGGMAVQAVGIAAIALMPGLWVFAAGSALLGLGTAMVYPTLLAAIGDVVHPSWRASSIGVYRLWRDAGSAFGAILAGAIADLLGMPAALGAVAALTFASGIVVVVRMRETLASRAPAEAAASPTVGARPPSECWRDERRSEGAGGKCARSAGPPDQRIQPRGARRPDTPAGMGGVREVLLDRSPRPRWRADDDLDPPAAHPGLRRSPHPLRDQLRRHVLPADPRIHG